jgi:hypothetical protein
MTGGSVASTQHLTEKAKRELLQRVLQSPILSSSRALQAFLQFVTEHEIAGQSSEIKEQRIGCEVLGRKTGYDPAGDNIVRVRAHELRSRLGKYFSTTGSGEPVIITIPRGSYVPSFLLRPATLEEDEGEASAGSACTPHHAAWTEAQRTAMRDLWGQFMSKPGGDLAVVASDAAFALWQDIAGQDLSLGDYLSRRYLEMGAPELREVATRRCMAPADLEIALRLTDVCGTFGCRVKAQFARNLSMADVRAASAVLLGSRRSNPWVQLFEAQLNFVLAQDAASAGPRFSNKAPLPGEPESFGIPCRLDIDGTERMEMESYALVALSPNLSGTGYVLILEGLNMEATEAAGEMVTNPERLTTLLRQIGHAPGSPVLPFEALIRLTSMPGGYANPKLVAYRDVHASSE